ncbi:MAG: MFS transporter [Myxococcota bacterium]
MRNSESEKRDRDRDRDVAASSSSSEEDSAEQPEPVRLQRPWWLPHFLGRVPIGLEQRHVNLVGVVALAGFFESYDLSVLSAALKQIRESFELSQSEMTGLLAWVRLGAIPAFLILPLADRFGRRRVYLAAILGMSLATLASAFAETTIQFIAIQTIARTFVVATIATATVIIAEELPAEHRGWGIGMLGAIGSFGYGFGALLYAFVEWIPFGWRALYIVGGLPLFLMPMLRRRITETKRFEEGRREAIENERNEGKGGFVQPLISLFREYPRRSLAVAAMGFSVSVGTGPAFGLLSDFVQTTHGWEPSSYSLMALVAGMVGIIGNPAMGWAADRAGRRPIAMVAFGLFPLIAFALYFGPSIAIAFIWMPFVFILTGGNVIMRTVTSELFPTSSRNTAMGLETLSETLGAAVGFALVGWFTVEDSSIAPAAVAMSLFTFLGVFVFWCLPETARRELEVTSQALPPKARS